MRELIDYLRNSNKLFSSVSVVIIIITVIIFSFIRFRKSTAASWFLGCPVTRTSMVYVVHYVALPLRRAGQQQLFCRYWVYLNFFYSSKLHPQRSEEQVKSEESFGLV
jgi:hypothetical protein